MRFMEGQATAHSQHHIFTTTLDCVTGSSADAVLSHLEGMKPVSDDVPLSLAHDGLLVLANCKQTLWAL